MPDLVTHIAVGHILKRLSPYPGDPYLFALGSALPDLVSRGPVALLLLVEHFVGWEAPGSIMAALPVLHSPLPYTLLCLLWALHLPPPVRTGDFWQLFLGGQIHLLLDTLQRHLDYGQRLLFPFSWSDFEAGWFDTEDSLSVAPYLVVAALIVELWLRYRRQTTQRAGPR